MKKKNNLACPYCNKIITGKSFKKGKWQCEHCKKLFNYEFFKDYYKNKEH